MNLLNKTILFFLLTTIVLAQTKLEQEIEKLKRNKNVKLEYLSNNRLSVTYNNFNTVIYNMGDNRMSLSESKSSIPKFVFNLNELDTSLYNYKYKFWREMPIGSESTIRQLIGDIDNNNREEIYGYKKIGIVNPLGIFCYELNQWGWFKQKYHYQNKAILPYNIYDIDRDGEPELHLVLAHLDTVSGYHIKEHTFYKKNAPDSLATQFYFDYNIYTGDGLNLQLDDFTFGDFDKDGTTDAIYISLLNSMHVVSFNEEDKTFDSVLTYSTYSDSLSEYEYMHGFVIDDMDMDGETDLIYTGANNNIYMLENGDSSKYSINWRGKTSIENSYILFKTNDIDGNGKPELWVGGQSFPQPKTSVTCFEMTGDNAFEAVAEIEFPGLASLYGLRGEGFDIDNDPNKKDELIISVGNTLAIMKFTGSTNDHNYEVFYKNTIDNNLYQVNMVTIHKFNSQPYPSIVYSMGKQNTSGLHTTKIYNHYLTTDVAAESEIKPTKYKLHQNYPNPFNPTTTINYQLPESGLVSLRVYDILGKEVATLVNEVKQIGKYSVEFNASISRRIPSGVYFYSLRVNDFVQNKKMVLLK